MPMIERVARALAESDPEYDPVWDYRPQARAAIEAMREPTEDMKSAGHFWAGEDCGPCFSSMIDAALEEDSGRVPDGN